MNCKGARNTAPRLALVGMARDLAEAGRNTVRTGIGVELRTLHSDLLRKEIPDRMATHSVAQPWRPRLCLRDRDHESDRGVTDSLVHRPRDPSWPSRPYGPLRPLGVLQGKAGLATGAPSAPNRPWRPHLPDGTRPPATEDGTRQTHGVLGPKGRPRAPRGPLDVGSDHRIIQSGPWCHSATIRAGISNEISCLRTPFFEVVAPRFLGRFAHCNAAHTGDNHLLTDPRLNGPIQSAYIRSVVP
jgi:hypothetical protein